MKTDELLKQAKENDSESSISSADANLASETEARRVFSTLKTKLLDINEWNAHSLMSAYGLFDEAGREIGEEAISIGAFIRIQLKASGKYDWIRVIDFHETPDEFIITVKPTFDPTAEKQDEKLISHFFTHESTNNFCLFRKDTRVGLYVVGLNEKQNTGETSGVLETARNIAVNLATYLGIQNGEWEKFCRHFLDDAAQKS